MEKEDSVRTVDCLRGRLLAERGASRNAKEKAEQLGNKLMELENLLKQEAKSRNRAEKKLKFLMKKLQSMNISYVSDESEHSGLMDKTDISSISSTTSSSTIREQNNKNQTTEISKALETQESEANVIPQTESKNSQKNDSQYCLSSLSDGSSSVGGTSISAFEVNSSNPTVEDSSSSAGDEHSEKSSSKMDQQSIKSCTDESLNKEDDQDSDSQIDNSMALVLVDSPKKNRTIDPEVLDATVKEVLDVLRHAKEQLQSSMERRRMNIIGVG